MEIENQTPLPERPKKDDPQTLRAKGGDINSENPAHRPTNPEKLYKSILHVLLEYDYAQIESVGPVALNVVMSAFRMAAREAEKRTNGAVLVLRQSEYTAIINGQPTKGIRSRVFAIPTKYAI